MSDIKTLTVTQLYNDVKNTIVSSPLPGIQNLNPQALFYSTVVHMQSFARLDPAYAKTERLYTVLEQAVLTKPDRFGPAKPALEFHIADTDYAKAMRNLKTYTGFRDDNATRFDGTPAHSVFHPAHPDKPVL